MYGEPIKSDGCAPAPTKSVRTVGQVLDERIAEARKRVLDGCIAKAKAEQLNLLDAPAQDLADILFF